MQRFLIPKFFLMEGCVTYFSCFNLTSRWFLTLLFQKGKVTSVNCLTVVKGLGVIWQYYTRVIFFFISWFSRRVKVDVRKARMSVHQCTPGFIVGRMWYAEDQDLLLMTYGGFLCRSCGVAPRVGCSTQGEGCRGRGSSSVATSCLRLEPVAVVPEGSCTPGGCACVGLWKKPFFSFRVFLRKKTCFFRVFFVFFGFFPFPPILHVLDLSGDPANT